MMDAKLTATRIAIIVERATTSAALDKHVLEEFARVDVPLGLETATTMDSAKLQHLLIHTTAVHATSIAVNTRHASLVLVDVKQGIETATRTTFLMDVKSTSPLVTSIADHVVIDVETTLIAVEEDVFAIRIIKTATITTTLMDVKSTLILIPSIADLVVTFAPPDRLVMKESA